MEARFIKIRRVFVSNTDGGAMMSFVLDETGTDSFIMVTNAGSDLEVAIGCSCCGHDACNWGLN